MIKLPFEEIVSKIKQKTGKTDEEINGLLNAKLTQLSGLISKEGAAHIIANELGVKIFENSGKIKDIMPGMRNTELVGKVTQIYEIKDFVRQDGSAGKLGSFVIADETASMRIVCWGGNANILTSLSQGTIVKISNGIVKQNRNFTEIHVNDNSKISLNPAGIEIGEVKENKSVSKKISELVETDENVEVKITVVQVYDPRFFSVCPQCTVKAKNVNNEWFCDAHGKIEPDFSYVLSLYADDGEGSINVVLFRNQVERLLNKTKEQMISFRLAPHEFEPVKNSILGEQFKVVGKVRRNDFSNSLEFIAQRVFPMKVEAVQK